MDEQGLNELEESARDDSKGLPEWKISKLRTHKYGKNPKFRWWWQKKKKFVADDSQYDHITIYRSTCLYKHVFFVLMFIFNPMCLLLYLARLAISLG